MIITAFIMSGLVLMTLIITVGLVVDQHYSRQHDLDTARERWAFEIEAKQLDVKRVEAGLGIMLRPKT